MEFLWHSIGSWLNFNVLLHSRRMRNFHIHTFTLRIFMISSQMTECYPGAVLSHNSSEQCIFFFMLNFIHFYSSLTQFDTTSCLLNSSHTLSLLTNQPKEMDEWMKNGWCKKGKFRSYFVFVHDWIHIWLCFRCLWIALKLN